MVLGLLLILALGMFTTNSILKKEYLKIDLTDTFKNYTSVNKETYKVLHISGSNGYPIDIIEKPEHTIKVLRSRQKHFKSDLRKDTLFVVFTGANISQKQAFMTDTPSGIIVESNTINTVIANNTNTRITGFSQRDLKLILEGNSLTKVFNCTMETLAIAAKDNSQFEFSRNNTIDSLYIEMSNNSVGAFEEVNFSALHHSLKDSVRLVLSKEVVQTMMR